MRSCILSPSKIAKKGLKQITINCHIATSCKLGTARGNLHKEGIKKKQNQLGADITHTKYWHQTNKYHR